MFPIDGYFSSSKSSMFLVLHCVNVCTHHVHDHDMSHSHTKWQLRKIHFSTQPWQGPCTKAISHSKIFSLKLKILCTSHCNHNYSRWSAVRLYKVSSHVVLESYRPHFQATTSSLDIGCLAVYAVYYVAVCKFILCDCLWVHHKYRSKLLSAHPFDQWIIPFWLW